VTQHDGEDKDGEARQGNNDEDSNGKAMMTRMVMVMATQQQW